MSSAAPLVETTEDRLRRELSQSSQAEARESLLREECARLRADNRALTLMSRSWRAALRDVLPVHRSRLEEYGEVARELYAARD